MIKTLSLLHGAKLSYRGRIVIFFRFQKEEDTNRYLLKNEIFFSFSRVNQILVFAILKTANRSLFCSSFVAFQHVLLIGILR